jgi:hypothetical protein
VKKSISLNSNNLYEIRVLGSIETAWLEGVGATDKRTEVNGCDESSPTVFKIVADQAGLVGLVRRMHGLGIVLLSIRLV